MNRINRPIIIIGAHRSGTTWLGQAFRKSSDVAYWGEPNYVWTWGNWFKGHDELNEFDASILITKYIRNRFHSFTNKNKALRLCEKTPSNCLRISFINKIFPEAMYIFLVRDGRAILSSAANVMESPIPWVSFTYKWKYISILDTPYFMPRLGKVVRNAFGKAPSFWGPRPKGWQEWMRCNDLDIILAKQWSYTISSAQRGIKELPDESFLTVKYEDILNRPKYEANKIIEFLGLIDCDGFMNYICETANPILAEKWREAVSTERIEKVKPYMDTEMRSLGYSW